MSAVVVVVRPAGSVSAGTASDGLPTLQAGQCAGIATGAVLPPGADAVVMIEDVQVDDQGQSIRLREGRQWPNKPGHDVRSPGSDLEASTILVGKGSVLQPVDVAMLAMAGVDARSVPLVPRLPVFVLSTGRESRVRRLAHKQTASVCVCVCVCAFRRRAHRCVRVGFHA